VVVERQKRLHGKDNGERTHRGRRSWSRDICLEPTMRPKMRQPDTGICITCGGMVRSDRRCVYRRRFRVDACASSYFFHKAVMPVLVDRNLAVCFHPAQLLLYLLPVQIVTGLVHGFRYFHRSARRCFCVSRIPKCVALFVCNCNTSLFYTIQPMSYLLDLVGLSQPVKSIL
jgi:hypothetical protein